MVWYETSPCNSFVAQSERLSLSKAFAESHKCGACCWSEWMQELRTFLRNYRMTPLYNPLLTVLLFSREPGTKLPNVHTKPHSEDHLVRSKDEHAKLRMKLCSDRKRTVKHHQNIHGDRVLRQNRRNKLSTNFSPIPLIVTTLTTSKGSMITAKKTRQVARHEEYAFLPQTSSLNVSTRLKIEEDSLPGDWMPGESIEKEPTLRDSNESAFASNSRRSQRIRWWPAYLRDYVQCLFISCMFVLLLLSCSLSLPRGVMHCPCDLTGCWCRLSD